MKSANRLLALDQALANTRIEGHRPTKEFLSDCKALANGKLSPADAIKASLERARAAERKANGPNQ